MSLSHTDDLANERTYLAYVRTALSFIAFGFVIARFSLFTREVAAAAHVHVVSASMSTPFGLAMAAFGCIVGGYGTARYVVVKRGIAEGAKAPLSSTAAILGGVATAIVGLAVAAVLILVR